MQEEDDHFRPDPEASVVTGQACRSLSSSPYVSSPSDARIAGEWAVSESARQPGRALFVNLLRQVEIQAPKFVHFRFRHFISNVDGVRIDRVAIQKKMVGILLFTFVQIFRECIGRAIWESYFSGALNAKICLGMPRESILGVILTAQPSLSIVQHR